MTSSRAAPIAALVLVLAGCPYSAGLTGRPLMGDAQVPWVQPGMEKAALFAHLGPPTAIVGRNETVLAPALRVRTTVVPSGGPVRFESGGSYPVQGNALLEVFRDRVALHPDHRVYYYRHAEDRGRRLWLPLAFVWVLTNTIETELSEFFVLVDERSGLAEAWVLRRPDGEARSSAGEGRRGGTP